MNFTKFLSVAAAMALLASPALAYDYGCGGYSYGGGTTTLYEVGAKPSYTVKFYGTYKDVTGEMADQSMNYGKTAKLKANKFTRKGYTFKGWATSKKNAKKGKVTYKNKAKVKNLTKTGKTVKFYAVWTKK